MLLKQQDPMVLEKKVNTTPVDYANSMNSSDPSPSCRPTQVEVPKELLKVSMVNTSLKKLKHHLAGFSVVVKERTTATAITEGSWGFEHTKACFRDEIIPFVKALNDIFNTFDQYLIGELFEVQNVSHQMEQAVEQHRLESKMFEVKMNQVLNENERLLEQVINKDIVNIIMNSSVDNASVNVHECEKCLKLETELLNKNDFIKKETYDKLFRSVKISQEKDTVIKKLKEGIKSLSGNVNEDKVKKDIEEIEMINIELDHRVSKLNAENEHLKQTYKQLYNSIKPTRIRSKEQCDALVSQVNQKSVEISDLNVSKRGLRQGDPMSPYLFTLVMEVLTLMLNRRARDSNSFTYHRYCSKLNIINLCFADDLFLFAHGDANSARVIMDSLEEFKNASGLTPSLPKSTAYFCNVLNYVKLDILSILPFDEGKLPVKYLGVPLVPSRLLYRDCSELIEKIKRRVSDWKNKSLSLAGRAQLIRSVLSSMHLYWASVFILPSSLMLELEQVMRGFLWCQGEKRKCKAKVAWEDVCLPKKEGGLGIRRLEAFNKALISSHIWSLLSHKESLWVKWIHTYKLNGRTFWEIPLRGKIS
ncbi:integrase, catalytic region, zinc finger, CCHC-type containing protein [Tanacetum coccineum]|uniref:Integrase, catalytic region, zinc finger, CCHC-type containing protein n=1 Tax=Tanacetum coccineum TaxID=301880 RepID=A0ABQ5CIN1_9ASTR